MGVNPVEICIKCLNALWQYSLTVTNFDKGNYLVKLKKDALNLMTPLFLYKLNFSCCSFILMSLVEASGITNKFYISF